MRLMTIAMLLVGAVRLCAQTTLISWDGPFIHSQFGSGVAAPGDLDGDGVPDFVVGARRDSALYPALTDEGSVTALSGFDGSQLWKVRGGAPGQFFGHDVAKAGDLDGDGRSDLVASAPGSAGVPGYTRILSGATGATIRDIAVATVAVDGGADYDGDSVPDQLGTFADSSGLVGVHVFSGATGGILHTRDNSWCPSCDSVAAAFVGDANGDGYEDFAVGFPDAPPGSRGVVGVIRGPFGFVHAMIQGEFDQRVGSTVSDLGDLTGDGVHEIGASYDDAEKYRVYDVAAGGVMQGSTFLWQKTSVPSIWGVGFGDGASLQDVNGDGVRDVVLSVGGPFAVGVSFPRTCGAWVLSGADGASILAQNVFAGVEPGTVAATDDINGDGIQDFIYGRGTGGQFALGRARVFTCAVLPAASVTDLGGGCGAFLPQLTSANPRIGNMCAVTATGAAPSSAAVLVVDVAPPAATTLGSCTWHADLGHAAAWFTIALPTTAAGEWTTNLLVPSIPTAVGLPVTLQLIVEGTPSALGFDLSNGLSAVLGF